MPTTYTEAQLTFGPIGDEDFGPTAPCTLAAGDQIMGALGQDIDDPAGGTDGFTFNGIAGLVYTFHVIATPSDPNPAFLGIAFGSQSAGGLIGDGAYTLSFLVTESDPTTLVMFGDTDYTVTFQGTVGDPLAATPMEGADDLMGSATSDTIDGGQGDDLMTGDFGRDVFVFDDRSRADTITDFNNGADRLEFTFFGPSFGMDDMTITQIGADLEIRTSVRDTVTLENFDLADLDVSDFIFDEIFVVG